MGAVDPKLEQKAQAAFRRLRKMSYQRRPAYMESLPESWRWRVAQLAAGEE